VRIDSGDLALHARRVRAILDEGGLGAVRIFASGNLDECRIARLLASGAPIDGFGIGTRLSTSEDASSLDSVYKLQAYAGIPRRKRSEGKQTWPGAKQVWRRLDAQGGLQGDRVMLDTETGNPDRPLLHQVMQAGQRLGPPRPVADIRAYAAAELGRLPARLRSLDPLPAEQAYPVEISAELRRLAAELDRLQH
jgi:nicotinate phosphoribosyltransferase